MNKKTLQRTLCFLLALCFCFSIAIKPIEAQAAAAVPWMVYALITYMAAVGITFTVSGGVDAMVDAIENKVNEYEQTTHLATPFWVIIEEGVSLQPSPNGGPNFNPNRGKFFFAANAAAAVTSFITWLVSDGGWDAGTNVNEGYSFGTFDVQLRDGSSYTDKIPCATSLIGEFETSNSSSSYKRANILLEGSSFHSSDSNDEVFVDGTAGVRINRIFYSKYNKSYKVYVNSSESASIKPSSLISAFNLGVPVDDFVNSAQITFALVNEKLNVGLVYNGYFYLLSVLQDVLFVGSTLSADIEIPTEIPEIHPLPNEGVLIETTTAAETLEELATSIEEIFIQTGTIPKPVPQVTVDPNTQSTPNPTPVPTPVPTPNPSYDDIEDLGLPSLGEALINKFPFCLPSDIGRIMDVFTAEPITPYWQVDLFSNLGGRVPFVGDTAIEIDFTEFEELGTISRWTTTIGYCLFLLLITRQMITW